MHSPLIYLFAILSSSRNQAFHSNVRPIVGEPSSLSMVSQSVAAYSHTGMLQKMQSKADVIAFSNELQKLISSGRVQVAEHKLLSCLRRFERLEEGINPDSIHFGIVIKGWCKGDGSSLLKAERLLDKMQDMYLSGRMWLRPNAVVFNNIIMSYSRQGNVSKVEELYEKMKDFYYEGNVDVKPNVLTLNFMLDSLSKSFERKKRQELIVNPSRAEDIIKNMKNEFGIRPDTITYNLFINAWVKSSHPDSARKAEAIVRDMIEQVENGQQSVEPDIFTYNSILVRFHSIFSDLADIL